MAMPEPRQATLRAPGTRCRGAGAHAPCLVLGSIPRYKEIIPSQRLTVTTPGPALVCRLSTPLAAALR